LTCLLSSKYHIFTDNIRNIYFSCQLGFASGQGAALGWSNSSTRKIPAGRHINLASNPNSTIT
jgi:hypothetical protein